MDPSAGNVCRVAACVLMARGQHPSSGRRAVCLPSQQLEGGEGTGTPQGHAVGLGSPHLLPTSGQALPLAGHQAPSGLDVHQELSLRSCISPENEHLSASRGPRPQHPQAGPPAAPAGPHPGDAAAPAAGSDGPRSRCCPCPWGHGRQEPHVEHDCLVSPWATNTSASCS